MSTRLEAMQAGPAAGGTAAKAPGGAVAAWRIAVRELTDHVTSARFLVIALLVLALTPLAVFVGARDFQTRLGEYDRLAAERQELAAGPEGEGISGMDYEAERILLRALHRPEPLSVLVRGLDGALPQYWAFTSLGVEVGPSVTRPQRIADVLGQLDIEFLVRVVLGLLAILLAFDAVAGEKELGTLRAVLSQPIPRTSFLAGKLLGGAITLLVPLAAAFLLALLSARAFGVGLLTAGTLAKVGLMAVASGVYLLCFYALGLLVSSLATSQKTALVVLLVAWVVAVLAVPPLATLAAQAVSPVPPAYAVETRKQALDEDIRREAELAMGTVYREVAGLPEGYAGTQWYLDNKEAIDRRVAPIMVDYLAERRRLLGEIELDVARRRARQSTVARAIMALSPAAAFAGAGADLAGTGDAAYRAWANAIAQQQSRLDEVLFGNPPMVRMRNGPSSFTAELREQPSIEELPAFTPPARDAAAAIARALPSLGLLGLYTAIFIAGAFVAFARYDVR